MSFGQESEGEAMTEATDLLISRLVGRIAELEDKVFKQALEEENESHEGMGTRSNLTPPVPISVAEWLRGLTHSLTQIKVESSPHKSPLPVEERDPHARGLTTQLQPLPKPIGIEPTPEDTSPGAGGSRLSHARSSLSSGGGDEFYGEEGVPVQERIAIEEERKVEEEDEMIEMPEIHLTTSLVIRREEPSPPPPRTAAAMAGLAGAHLATFIKTSIQSLQQSFQDYEVNGKVVGGGGGAGEGGLEESGGSSAVLPRAGLMHSTHSLEDFQAELEVTTRVRKVAAEALMEAEARIRAAEEARETLLVENKRLEAQLTEANVRIRQLEAAVAGLRAPPPSDPATRTPPHSHTPISSQRNGSATPAGTPVSTQKIIGQWRRL